MKLQIYSLRKEFEEHPERMKRIHEITLDKTRPMLGFKGRYGLLGSELWWDNVDSGKLRMGSREGLIIDHIYTGMNDDDMKPNTILCKDKNNLEWKMEMYPTDQLKVADIFKIGNRVTEIYVLDRTKLDKIPFLVPDYAEVIIEVWVEIMNA